jgi:SH3-like domain-containing protein
MRVGVISCAWRCRRASVGLRVLRFDMRRFMESWKRWVPVALASGMALVGAGVRAEESSVPMRSVGVDVANFRVGPSLSERVLYTADRYYPVQVLRCEGGWCRTRDFEQDVAWVAERLLSDQRSVVINVNQANVRVEPTTTARVLFRVDWGEALKVTERKGEWLSVEDITGERGWLHAKLTWGLAPEGQTQDGGDAGKAVTP